MTCPICGAVLDTGTCAACATTPRYAHEGQPPGYLWEYAEDRCQLCHAHIGYGVRFLHLGLCDDCRAKPAN